MRREEGVSNSRKINFYLNLLNVIPFLILIGSGLSCSLNTTCTIKRMSI